MVSGERNKLPMTESSRVQQVAKFRRDLIAVISDNGIDILLEIKDRAIAEYILRSVMSLSKIIDDIHELEN